MGVLVILLGVVLAVVVVDYLVQEHGVVVPPDKLLSFPPLSTNSTSFSFKYLSSLFIL